MFPIGSSCNSSSTGRADVATIHRSHPRYCNPTETPCETHKPHRHLRAGTLRLQTRCRGAQAPPLAPCRATLPAPGTADTRPTALPRWGWCWRAAPQPRGRGEGARAGRELRGCLEKVTFSVKDQLSQSLLWLRKNLVFFLAQKNKK